MAKCILENVEVSGEGPISALLNPVLRENDPHCVHNMVCWESQIQLVNESLGDPCSNAQIQYITYLTSYGQKIVQK
jgi:hypothetical protein